MMSDIQIMEARIARCRLSVSNLNHSHVAYLQNVQGIDYLIEAATLQLSEIRRHLMIAPKAEMGR